MSNYFDIDLNQSVNTDTINEDVKIIGVDQAPHVAFNGIERDGGLTNVYEKEVGFGAETDSYIDDNGDVYTMDPASPTSLRKNGTKIVSLNNDYSLIKQFSSDLYCDVMICQNGDIVAMTKPGPVQQYHKLDATGNILATRNAGTISNGFVRHYSAAWANATFRVWYRGIQSATQVYLSAFDDNGTNLTTALLTNDWITNEMVYIYEYRDGATKKGFLVLNPGQESLYIAGTSMAGTKTVLFASKSYWAYLPNSTANEYEFHIVTGTPTVSGTTLTNAYKVGFYTNVAGTFGTSAITQTTGSTPTLGKCVAGPGYSSANVLSGTTWTNFSYSFPYAPLGTGIAMGTTEPPMDMLSGYIHGVSSSGSATFFGVNFRCPLLHSGGVAGTESPSLLSIAYTPGGAPQYMGVPLSSVGGFDIVYPPSFKQLNPSGSQYAHIAAFFDNGLWQFRVIGNNAYRNAVYPLSTNVNVPMFEKINKQAFRINNISPVNVFDTEDGTMYLGTSDYAGGVLYSGTSGGVGYSGNYSCASPYASVIDTGTRALAPDGTPLGALLDSYLVNNLAYFYFYRNGLAYAKGLVTSQGLSFPGYFSTNVSNDTTQPIYQKETRIPIPIGATLSNGTATFSRQTAFLAPNFLGYEVGNYIKGDLAPFQLFSQNYVFNGSDIYISPVDSVNTLQSTDLSPVNIVARAQGLRFIAVSPNVIYFYSDFDRSLFAFDGGRTLQKIKRLNQLESVNSGVYNVRDNTLLLDTANTFVWVRDGIYSEQSKKTAQTNLRYQSTDKGIYIINASYYWQYSYLDPGSATIVPFTWQSAYFGKGLNAKINISAFILVLYSESKAATTWNIMVNGFDGNAFWTENKVLDITPADYNTAGYARFRVQPINQKALAMSLGISTTSTTSRDLLNQVTVEWVDDTTAIISASRTV